MVAETAMPAPGFVNVNIDETRLMRPLSTAICHIGIGHAIVRPGLVPLPRNLLPRIAVDGGETSVAFWRGMHLGDFETVGESEEMRVDLRAAEHGDLGSAALQR